MIEKNPVTDFAPAAVEPDVDPSAFVHPLAAVIGNVRIGRNVMVCPAASVRGDEGQPIHVGDDSNVQDSVVIHALETCRSGRPEEENLVEVAGDRFAVHVGSQVSLAHQAQIHGPASVGDDTFVGMKALVFRARIGRACVLEPASVVLGVTVSDGRYVPAGAVVTTQELADNLPHVSPDYPYREINRGVVRVNTALARAYRERG